MHAADACWPIVVIGNPDELHSAIRSLTAELNGHGPAWKGVARAEWTLRSTLDRMLLASDPGLEYRARLARERGLLEEFRLLALPFAADLERKLLNSIEDEAVWDVIAVARHSGLPTRVVDWTTSPLVAAFFACMEHTDADGVIWWFDQMELETILGDNWDKWRVDTKAHVYRCTEIDPAKQVALGLHHRHLSSVAFSDHCEAWLTKLHYPVPFPRMEAQQGFMTMCGRVQCDHNDAIDTLPLAQRLRRGRLLIKKEAKGAIMNWLHDCNVSARSLLYPGIDIAARFLAKRV